MSKHTKGPWRVNKTRLGSVWIGGNEVGDTGFMVEIGSICTEYGPMSRANADLIAAAPDLLAALKKLLSYGFGDDQGGKMARDAIAKAEGVKS